MNREQNTMPRLSANGVALNYILEGQAGAPVVVFSNSLGTTHRMWDEVAAEIAKSYQILRYDTRGHGGSEVVTKPAAIDDLAADLASLLDGLGIGQVHVVGLSLGGMTGQCFAANYPKRVQTLTLMATSAHLPPADGWQARADTVRAEGMSAIADAVIERWFTPSFAASGAVRLAAVRQELLATDPEGYARACEVIRDMDLRPRLPSVSCPTLVVAGADDPATPVMHSETIVTLIKGARLVVIEKAAHLLAVEQHAAASENLLEFLKSEGAAG
jgi:3-oxoadipate enol-lactonase